MSELLRGQPADRLSGDTGHPTLLAVNTARHASRRACGIRAGHCVESRTAGTHGGGFARVRNVVARLPGTRPTGVVFLVAHDDSVQVGPGGNDDAAGTAALLEGVRALRAGPQPRNDLMIVLTDAEEAGLCGASTFADRGFLVPA